jgi:hypothetical protein
MSLPTSKSELLDRLRNERAQWQTLLNSIDASQIDVPGVVGIWSVKDTLAHVLAYEQFLADRMREIPTGATYHPGETQEALDAFQERFGYPDFGSPLLDDDGPNAWIVQKYRAVTFPTLTHLEAQVFKDIQDLLAELSEGQLDQHDLYARVASNTFEHYHEHSPDIRKWLATLPE